MPHGAFHRKINKLVTGKSGQGVNRLMDSTTKIHPGIRHRKDPVHDPAFVFAMGLDELEPDAVIHSVVHELVDKRLTVRQAKMIDAMAGITESERSGQ